MHDYATFKHTAIRYWERRRIFYNLALVPPAFVGYVVTAGFIYATDPDAAHYGRVLWLFVLSAFGANVCYSFAYALEFLFGSDDPASWWLRFGRSVAFYAGVVFAMLLALFGGRDIAQVGLH